MTSLSRLVEKLGAHVDPSCVLRLLNMANLLIDKADQSPPGAQTRVGVCALWSHCSLSCANPARTAQWTVASTHHLYHHQPTRYLHILQTNTPASIKLLRNLIAPVQAPSASVRNFAAALHLYAQLCRDKKDAPLLLSESQWLRLLQADPIVAGTLSTSFLLFVW